MTEVTLDPADAAAASGPSAPPGTSRALGARIDAIGIGQHAGERQILHEVSLSVEPGELIALAGGSGAGKTTLLEILAGLRAPSAGQVTHDGVRVDAGATRHFGIGYVPQDDIIHGEMPLRRTLQYAALLRLPAGTSSGQADRVVDDILRELDLADRRDVAVRMLSGGQRKRASIAVELLTRPGTFFLDEPTSGLDPSTSAEVVRLLRQLTRRGVTVVLTTHEPTTIDRCNQVADRRYLGTALTTQTAIGFGLTIVTIQAIPLTAGVTGWRYAFLALAAGPMTALPALSRQMRPNDLLSATTERTTP